MILAIDIGNTTIGIGVFEEDTLIFCEKISSKETMTDTDYIDKLNQIFLSHSLSVTQLEGSILSSVVPHITDTFWHALEVFTGKKVLLLSCDLDLGLTLCVDYPQKVGCDRLADAVSAANRYPLPIITIDMGTATTINVIDANRCFLGGIIMPGVRTANRALLCNTAQLKDISDFVPSHTIGTNTDDCIASGMIYGTACSLDGLIQRIEKELNTSCTVVATGGYAPLVIPHCQTNIISDPQLLMNGLNILYQKNI